MEVESTKNSAKILLKGEELELLYQRALFWKEKRCLFITDLHLGKVNHFRKSGIPVPAKANDKNIEMLVELIQQTNAQRIIFLGDLFHSYYNPEWEVFGEVVKHFGGRQFELVLGNHDILSEQQYVRKKIAVHTELKEGPFTFTHHPVDGPDESVYYISGHVHPGVRLRGKGKQAVTLPCFYFGERQALLPAFGTFTGFVPIKPKSGDQVYVVFDGKVMQVE
ncbi:MAG: ligase-associated DNA damage response endonuclease PdeM [Flammeovirgaceae bacterium]|nr:ligase-associated DNA damage response endonuclease PdeM [Flammeovirgaceae bacterium]